MSYKQPLIFKLLKHQPALVVVCSTDWNYKYREKLCQDLIKHILSSLPDVSFQKSASYRLLGSCHFPLVLFVFVRHHKCHRYTVWCFDDSNKGYKPAACAQTHIHKMLCTSFLNGSVFIMISWLSKLALYLYTRLKAYTEHTTPHSKTVDLPWE